MGINKVYISEVPPIVLRNPGKDGTSGTSGVDGSFFGSSGTSGVDGTFVGSSGTSGITGVSGSDGTSGSSGVSGSNGTSGVSGSNGISGTSGVSGTDGVNGTSGIDGTNGTNGVDGTSGSSGFSIDSGSFATTGSNTFIGDQILSGALYFNDDYNSTQAAMGMFQAVSGSGSPLFDNASKDFVILSPTSDITLVTLLNNAPFDTLTDIAQVSLTRSGSLDVYANMNVSGSIIPAVGNGTFTSSFSLGSATNAWKDLYISHGSIIFVDSITRATSSFSITTDTGSGENTVQYTAAITASSFIGDGSRLTNLPATTNWNKDKEYILRNTEQLTFSGDYILENALLVIEGSIENSVGEWEERLSTHSGSISQLSNNQFEIIGPNATGGASDGNLITRYFDTETTMSVRYGWSGRDIGDDWPFYDIQNQYPIEYGNTNMLQDTNAESETGTWIINVPSGSWVSFGVWTNSSNEVPGNLQITLPYIFGENVEYSPNKYFKKEGTIFIGGNLLVKDSTIINNGKISVGGEVILIGNSQIEGTGTII